MASEKGLYKLHEVYTNNQESPWRFHFWALTSAIGVLASRRIWLNRGYYKLFPNQYIILTANSAMCRKNFPCELVQEYLLQVQGLREENGLVGMYPVVYSGKITKEKLFELIAVDPNRDDDSPPILIAATEFGTLISKHAILNGLVDDLTDYYTSPSIPKTSGTKKDGLQVLRNWCFHVLGATTPDWLGDSIPQSVFNQGFVGRVVFVYGKKPRHRIATPRVDAKLDKVRQEILNRLYNLSFLEGEMKWDPEAEAMYEDWYQTREEPSSMTAQQSGFFGREHEHVLKLAMCLSLADSDSLILKPEHFSRAVEEFSQIYADLPTLFSDVIFNGELPIVKKICSIMEEEKRLTRSVLGKKLYKKFSLNDIDDAINGLVALGVLKRVEIPTEGMKRTEFVWVGEKKAEKLALKEEASE